MRVVIGSGSNRHVFDVPREPKERQAMADELNRILFKQRN